MKIVFLRFPESNGMGAFLTRLVWIFAGLLAFHRAAAQCSPDLTPPTVICNEFVQISLSPSQSEVSALAFNDGSYDDCCLDTLLVRRMADGPCDGDAQDDPFTGSVLFCCADLGQDITVVMRAYDCSGNYNDCLVSVAVEDKIKPVCQAPANVTVSCENFDPSLLAYGTTTSTDNCCVDTVQTLVNYTKFDTICTKGTITRTFRVYDCSGNISTCTQSLVVNYAQNYFVRFPNDVIVTTAGTGNGNYGQPVFFGEDCELIGVSYEDQFFTQVPDATYRLERRWTVINWCSYNPNLGVVEVPNPTPNALPNHPTNLPGPIVSAAGTAAPWAPTIVKVNATDPAPTNYSTFFDPNANGYRYMQIIKVIDTFFVAVTGTVFTDTLSNCSFDNGEPTLANWTVRATGAVTGAIKETNTNAAGQYEILLSGLDTALEVTLVAPFNFAQSCPSVYILTGAVGQTQTQNIPVVLETGCPLMSVDLAAPFLRRCFPSNYTVQACNLSHQTIEDVHVEVALDTFLTYASSSVPGTPLGNNTVSFEVGDLAAGECQSFTVQVLVQCAAPFGYTHCSTAHIFPDTLCPVPANWSGADIEVTGYCDGDSTRLTIANVGVGDMVQPLDFVVVEDVIMFQSGTFQLASGASQTIAVPANGSTWRLQAEEEVNHPWGGVEATAVEGCGGLNTPGLVTMFSMSSTDPFESTDCQENVGSFDPNDKQAFPRGYGSAHQIEATADIEYLIRFQNTGTDTAFTVVVLDTLSEYLDPASVRPGASSHPCEFGLLEGNVLRFRFDNILLPDSNKNEAASHGFIKFRVAQTPDNPNGTLIENTAAIFFDFNDPVLTNTTFHTVGDHFILVQTDNPVSERDALRVYPNPSTDAVHFDLKEPGGYAVFVLTDPFGKTLRRERFSGGHYRFERQGLQAGMYFFKIEQTGGITHSGKVILR